MLQSVATDIVWVNNYIVWQAIMWVPTLKETNQPKYILLVEAIAEAIEKGELKVGERLPPQRQLAWKLNLNPSTTMQAYREAARRHLVSGEVGRGTYVLPGSKEASLFLIKNPPPLKERIDLSTNLPAIDQDNRDLASTFMELTMSAEWGDVQSYLTPDAIQSGKIRATEWLKLRKVSYLPENIKLCAGAQQGLMTVLLSLCQRGESILVEELTAPGIKAASRQLHLPLHGIMSDEQGIIPDEFDRMIRTTGARVVILTPSLQNPTGTVMGHRRRGEVADIINKYQLIMIEDDVYGGLIKQPPLSVLLPERTILISSFSKTVAAGLRLGYIAAPVPLLSKIDPDAQLTHWAVSSLNLMIANRWIEDGTAEKRLNWQRREVAQRWHLARKLVGQYMLNATCPSPHVWLTAPFETPELVQLCSQAGINVVSADVFAVRQAPLNAIRISLTAAKNQVQLKSALETIATLLAV
ncbi:TPA: PLP-dependent aminotransferase family protein [Raoultella ornithinolytica]|uniref:aminotransferase-like domain-containing protein n=1 Tax=Raoultella sp. XY-1 TaxID=2799495 RepID=UPI001D114A8C|nr:PLP-dependent aminotransferase family protein [Raoultella sp. XY-1]